MTKMCLVVVDLGGMAKRGLPWSRSVGAVPGSYRPPVHGLPAYQRLGAAAYGHAPRTGRYGRATAHGSLTPCSLVRRTHVVRRGTQIIYVRRILLGHSLPSPAGRTAPPPPVTPEQRELVSSLNDNWCFAPAAE
ncbi:hypothetical protein GCM10009535_56320 [Streptomyces thermocarboxydovorans]|uniref:Uncharacterized protein n=1 Tax=Streptomyces thermocarboxydovorans TaxID=59298 RepID=A0ABN1HV85_9ACTN